MILNQTRIDIHRRKDQLLFHQSVLENDNRIFFYLSTVFFLNEFIENLREQYIGYLLSNEIKILFLLYSK